MKRFAFVVLVGCSSTTTADGGTSDAPSCSVGMTCGSDCSSAQQAPSFACGTLSYDKDCNCRPMRQASWPDCTAPGPASEGDFCGTYWWCTRACAQGLTCDPIPKDGGTGGGDFRTTCQKSLADAGPG